MSRASSGSIVKYVPYIRQNTLRIGKQSDILMKIMFYGRNFCEKNHLHPLIDFFTAFTGGSCSRRHRN